MRIITVTPSTAIDEVLEVKQVQSTKPTVNTIHRRLFPSGKGINMARTISSLERNVIATGFVGEKDRAEFESLRSDYLTLMLTAVCSETRINTTVCDVERLSVLHIRRPPFLVQPKEYERFECRFKQLTAPGDVIIFAGTLPRGIHSKAYAQLIAYCREHQMTTILDSSGDDLRAMLHGKPFMIKPNVEELGELTGKNMLNSSPTELLSAAKDAAEGVRLIVVSRGSEGVLVFSRDANVAWTACVDAGLAFAPTAAIGSGDALVAGFAIGLAERQKMPDMIRLAVACGAANLFSIGPGVVRKVDVDRLYTQVKLEQFQTH